MPIVTEAADAVLLLQNALNCISLRDRKSFDESMIQMPLCESWSTCVNSSVQAEGIKPTFYTPGSGRGSRMGSFTLFLQ